jgi:hypothetical protein
VNVSQTREIRNISKSPSWGTVEALLEECVSQMEREALNCRDHAWSHIKLASAQGARDVFNIFKRAVEDANGGFANE